MDTIRILSKFGVPFIEHHHAVSRKAVGIDCPWCHDTDKHCGVFRESGKFSCFKCGKKGSLLTLLRKLKGVTDDEFYSVAGISRPGDTPKAVLDAIFTKSKTKKKVTTVQFDFHSPMLKPATKKLPPLQAGLIDHFKRTRKFTDEDLEYFGAKIGIAGEYMNRLAIPVPPPFINAEPAGIIARDLMNRSDKKYLVTEGLEVHDFIYPNMATSDSHVLVLVEGVFDVWASKRFMTYGLFGKQLHPKQLGIITRDADIYSTVVVALDGDARTDIMHIRQKIQPFFERVIPLYLHIEEDPASLGNSTFERRLKEVLK